MGRMDPKYSDEQRESVATAYNDRGIRPAEAVTALAAAGELDYRGTRLEAFTIPASYVRDIARRARKRRAGDVEKSSVAALPPRDAVETLRRRLVVATEHELDRAELAQRRGKPVPGEDLRQLARAVREIAAIPAPGEARPNAPGRGKGAAASPDHPTTGGLAGAILSDHTRASRRETATDTTPPTTGTGDTGSTSTTHPTQEEETSKTDGRAGLRADGALGAGSGGASGADGRLDGRLVASERLRPSV